MEKIADGENEKKAIEDGKGLLRTILEKFGGNEKDIGLGLLSGLKKKEMGESLLGKCVKCGNGELRVIRSRLGKQFVGCSNYPNCTSTYPLPQNAKIIALGKACEKCGTPTIRVIRKARKPFEMCLDPLCETKKGWAKPMPAPKAAAEKGGEEKKQTPTRGETPPTLQDAQIKKVGKLKKQTAPKAAVPKKKKKSA